jgi:hypothetical protein
MPFLVDPVPTDEELAAIIAALDACDEPESAAPPAPSRWRAAGRVYDDEAPALR